MNTDHDRTSDVTRILNAVVAGETRAADELLPLVYAELRALAQKHLSAERADHTLQATALVHEAYIRMVDHKDADWKGRGYFYVAAGEAMRRVLIDHARRSGAAKRGGDWNNVSLKLADLAAGQGLSDLLAVNDALDQLAVDDPHAARVVNLRFFAGLSVDETAEALGISPRTVDREWQYAKAWLRKKLGEDGEMAKVDK
ncbi:MAG: sigma-70 family RNA polymerase sigma factor [Planctomycetes bacterium]|nr:sigma-70 family RNA polymerase sigma factor [Planctomycetota bacterium]